jgi:hypothetical protein
VTTLRTRIAAAAIVSAAAFSLTGCYNGFGASTNSQNTMSTGNGVQAQVGSMRVENATLVRGEGNSATLMMTLVNVGPDADQLSQVTIAGVPAVATDGTSATGPIPIAGSEAVPFAYGIEGNPPSRWMNVYSVELPDSGFVPVQMLFDVAGAVELEVLTVPPVSFYEGIEVRPATAPSV